MTRQAVQTFSSEHISTHTLTWSVTFCPFIVAHFFKFQLTRSRGAWQVTAYQWTSLHQFQLTRSRGAWPLRASISCCCLIFQLTRSRGAWLYTYRCCTRSLHHFNSHAHVERDMTDKNGKNIRKISTHTLTWSVTTVRTGSPTRLKFQLTRSRGAWRFTVEFSITSLSFQLTRSRGAWQSSKWRYCFWRQFQLTRSRGAWL